MQNSNSNNNSSGGRGIGFVGGLTLAFIILKLCHIINWSWVWVLSPIWIAVLLIIILAIVLTWIFK